MEPAAHLDLLSERADALLGAASGSMDLPVPACPGWTVADLVAHIGQVWGWAAEIVTTKVPVDRVEPPWDQPDGDLRTWAQGEAARLLAALRAADPDAECWTFGPPHSVRFWFRRQALETVLHAWDAEGAVGAPSHFDPDVAADGIDEHLSVIVPRSVRRHPGAWNGETLHLHRTDGDGEWVVRLGPEGDVATERAHSRADLALRGTAQSLWLWCANRATADELGIERFGDEEIAARWREEMAF